MFRVPVHADRSPTPTSVSRQRVRLPSSASSASAGLFVLAFPLASPGLSPLHPARGRQGWERTARRRRPEPVQPRLSYPGARPSGEGWDTLPYSLFPVAVVSLLLYWVLLSNVSIFFAFHMLLLFHCAMSCATIAHHQFCWFWHVLRRFLASTAGQRAYMLPIVNCPLMYNAAE
jgi:hypothetical protein